MSKFFQFAPIITAVTGVVYLIFIRLGSADQSVCYGMGLFISSIVISSLKTLIALRRLIGVMIFGLFFVILIQSLSMTPHGVSLQVTQEAIQLAVFLASFFWLISILTGYFSSTDWHHGLSILGVPMIVSGFLFGGVAAVNIIRDHAEMAALLARIRNGNSWNPFRRFRVFSRAAVPLFYASLIKLESCLHAQQQRGLRKSPGVILAGGTTFYLRAYLFAGLSAAIILTIYNHG